MSEWCKYKSISHILVYIDFIVLTGQVAYASVYPKLCFSEDINTQEDKRSVFNWLYNLIYWKGVIFVNYNL